MHNKTYNALHEIYTILIQTIPNTYTMPDELTVQ